MIGHPRHLAYNWSPELGLNALAVTKIILSWVSVTGVSQYLVQYRFNNTNWVSEIVFRPDFELLNTD